MISDEGMDFPEELIEKVRASYRKYREEKEKMREEGRLCPNCDAEGEWANFAMKCPKCWKTW